MFFNIFIIILIVLSVVFFYYSGKANFEEIKFVSIPERNSKKNRVKTKKIFGSKRYFHTTSLRFSLFDDVVKEIISIGAGFFKDADDPITSCTVLPGSS